MYFSFQPTQVKRDLRGGGEVANEFLAHDRTVTTPTSRVRRTRKYIQRRRQLLTIINVIYHNNR